MFCAGVDRWIHVSHEAFRVEVYKVRYIALLANIRVEYGTQNNQRTISPVCPQVRSIFFDCEYQGSMILPPSFPAL